MEGCGVLEQRARGAEILDQPDGDPLLVERSYRLMRFVNRTGGGIHAVREFLARELSGFAAGKTVRVLDLGTGHCDIPLAVSRWANRQGYSVEFTCLDHNGRAIEMAQKAMARPGDRGIKLEHVDIFRYQPAGEFDYAVGSMFFHHLTPEEIGKLIEHLRGFVRRAVLINDLHRCPLNYLICRLLTVRVGPEVRHDALLSVRRGFKPAELSNILVKHDPAATVRRSWLCRVVGVVRFDGKEGQ